MLPKFDLVLPKGKLSFDLDAYVFGQNANSGRSTKIGTTKAPSACSGLPSHLTKPLTYVF